MRMATRAAVFFCNLLFLATQGLAQGQDVDTIISTLQLNFVDAADIRQILTADREWAANAASLRGKLEVILSENPADANAVDEATAIRDLNDLVEKAFSEVMDTLGPVPRAAWDATYLKMKGKLKTVIDAEQPGKKFAKLHERYTAIAGQLEKLMMAGRPVPDADPPSSIVPARFWMGAAQTSQVYGYEPKALESTTLLAKAFDDALSLPPTASAANLHRELNLELRAFLLGIQDTRTERTVQAWQAFLTLWGNALAEADEDEGNTYNNSNPGHVRAAYTQASTAVIQLGKNLEAAHQRAADQGQVMRPADNLGVNATSRTGSRSFGGTPHHARTMSRIYRRHERIMSRIRARR